VSVTTSFRSDERLNDRGNRYMIGGASFPLPVEILTNTGYNYQIILNQV
jgi:hypothetical protein